jgi:hypothetical protein
VGRGKKGFKLSNSFWKSDGIPGNMHSLPSSRTTGWKCILVHDVTRRGENTYNPDVASDKKNLASFRKQCHTFTGCALLLALLRDPCAVSVGFLHTRNGFVMVFELLSERLGERGVCDISKWRQSDLQLSQQGLMYYTIMGGPYTTRGDNEIIFLDHPSASLKTRNPRRLF